MTSNLPPWTALEAGALPPPSAAPGEGGRLVAVLATDGALAAGWAESCVVSAAGAWANAGERIVLADLNLQRPTLHTELDLPNAEGLSDVLLWGASVRHVAQGVRRTGESGFYLIPAGTAVADPAAALDSPRWAPLCDGFRAAGVTLVAFVSAEAPVRNAVLARSSAALVIATEHEDLGALATAITCPVMAVVGHRNGRSEAEAPTPAPSPEVEESPAPEALGRTAESPALEPVDVEVVEPEVFEPVPIDAEAPRHEAGPPEPRESVAVPASEPPSGEMLLDQSADAAAPRIPPLEEVLKDAAPSKSGRRVLLLLILLLVVLLGVVGAAMLGYVQVPGIPVLASPVAGSSSVLPALRPAGSVHDHTPRLPA